MNRIVNPLILLTCLALLGVMACDPATSSENTTTGAETNAENTPTHHDFSLSLNEYSLCLEGGGTQNCQEITEVMVVLTLTAEGPQLTLAEESLPPLTGEEPFPGLEILADPGVQLHMEGSRLQLEDGEGGAWEKAMEDGESVGFLKATNGKIAVFDGSYGCYALKSPCQDGGYVEVGPKPDVPGKAIISDGIGTVMIVDAFDTLNIFFAPLLPNTPNAVLPGLTPLVPEIVNEIPRPIDPLDGEEYFLIGGDTLAESSVVNCSVPCPADLKLCKGYMTATSTKKPYQSCSMYAGKCPVKAYAKNGQLILVRDNRCPSF